MSLREANFDLQDRGCLVSDGAAELHLVQSPTEAHNPAQDVIRRRWID